MKNISFKLFEVYEFNYMVDEESESYKSCIDKDEYIKEKILKHIKDTLEIQ